MAAPPRLLSTLFGKPKGGYKERMKHYLTTEQEERKRRKQERKVHTCIVS